MYCAYVTRLKNVRKMENADRLLIAECYGNQVIVSINHKEGELGVYFPTDGQLGEHFCQVNDLVRRKDENGNSAGGYLDPDKRNIRALKLRGERSEGLWLPISCLDYLGVELREGDTVTALNGEVICKKYVPRHNPPRTADARGKHKKNKKTYNFVFPEHIDTLQLAYNLDNFKPGDRIAITEKMEGTSHRSARVLEKKTNWFRKLLHLPPKTEWKDVCGSRRVTLEEKNNDGGFYGTNDFRFAVHEKIKPWLMDGMEVFAEIVGWPGPGMPPLMGETDTTCLNNKEFTKEYGKKMVFDYGCPEGTFDFYVYRICLLDDDGDVKVEFSTEQIVAYCAKAGWKHVPILYCGMLGDSPAEEVEKLAKEYCDGPSTIGHNWREGCVIRRDNGENKFDVYKHKNFAFKMMRGLATEKMQTEGLSEDIIEEMA